ncbi:MAG: hypothetical protein R3D62_09875 [Xanthobacteraceae bacterium]
MTLLSMAAIIVLPRQFRCWWWRTSTSAMSGKRSGCFRSICFLINLFVLPIAFGGLLAFPGRTVDADTFVLTLPMKEHHQAIALFVFLGGLSARDRDDCR